MTEVNLPGAGDRIYRQFVDTASEGTASLAADGRILSCSACFAKTLRRPLDQVLGTALRDHLSPADLEVFSSIRVQDCPEPSRRKIRLKTGDGALVPVYLSATLQHRAGEEPVTCVVVTDLEEVISAEERLRESETRYRALFENSPDAVLLTVPDGSILSANPAACRMFGRTEEELRRLGRDVIVDAADHRLPQLLEERARRGSASGELTCLRKDGSSFPAEASSILFSDRSGAPRSSMIIRDITERKRAEAEREQLTVAIEAAGETVLVTDARGTIQYVNPVFETVTGYRRAEVLGKHSRILKSGEHSASLYREALDTISSGRVWRGRLLNSRKDGSLFTVETTISPVRDETGRIASYVGVERDITEQLRLVEERTRLEDQLRQAQKIEAIGRLAGGVAHDFNNLTAIVLGYGEMLLGRLRADDPARKWAEQIVEAGNRSAALTRQLLAFSRKQTLLPEVLDLNTLLRNLDKMLGRLIGEDIRLELTLAPDLGCITADPGQIEQVVTNLVINARDAMPRGGRLGIETAVVELDEAFAREHAGAVPGKYVMLVLTDTGCGMDQATLARVFEPFFTTKERGKGTGLGLATAFGVVKQSGGYLYVSSEPGRGTTFTIYLPWTDAKPKVKTVEGAGASPQRGSGERILLVEDEAPLRELCATILSRLGYRVSSAGNGAEALRMVEVQGLEPDLVLADVVMPGMSGSATVERLRLARPALKALYMSGHPDATIASHGVFTPGACFLQKPFTEGALAAKLREALGPGPAAAPPGRRVLMIDDDDQFIELLGHFFRKRGHGLVGAGSTAEALEALAGEPFDLLLVDLNLPGSSGEQALREIRAAGHAAPAIVLTGDVASADLSLLRPLGVIRALEKSSNAEPLLRAIEEAGAP